MKRFLFIVQFILITVLVTSCCPCRHLTTSQRDSVRVETSIRTVYIHDTAWIKVPVEVVRQTVLVDTSHLETSVAVSDARINFDGSLSHSLVNKPQEKPVPYERLIEFRDSIVYRNRAVRDIVEVPRPLTWWQKTQIRGFWILLAVLVFIVRVRRSV